MTKRQRFELWQDGIKVAAVDCPTRDRAWAEILHYAAVYSQDGPVEIRGDGGKRLPATAGHGECASVSKEQK